MHAHLNLTYLLISSKNLSPECIIARINFPNGAKNFRPFENQPLPLPWEISKFNNWCDQARRSWEWKHVWSGEPPP